MNTFQKIKKNNKKLEFIKFCGRHILKKVKQTVGKFSLALVNIVDYSLRRIYLIQSDWLIKTELLMLTSKINTSGILYTLTVCSMHMTKKN